ncbi:MAG TPA: universal stress protein [Chthoniobacterales bacterium]|jgi:nucleotide-binding universal stress UspA family protein|nr:universal stress protein [Chthoniobacterales bacterium]
MYKNILVPVENRETDQTILRHIRSLARLTQARLTLVHVADGWAARNFERFQLQESEEMKHDREYLTALSEELKSEGFEVNAVLAMGEPATEIIKLARSGPVDLIAMTTHGHKLIADFLRGSTADKVRHEVDIPVLLLKVQK